MKKPQFIFLSIIVCTILIASFVGLKLGFWHQSADSAKPVEGFPAPNFTLLNLQGKTVELKKIIAKNNATLVNFWATWCPPCREEIPDFVKFYQKYSSKDVTILAIDLREQPNSVKKFALRPSMKFPILMDTDGKVGNLYQVFSIPNTFIIDRKGTIRSVIKGGTNFATLEQKVRPLLR